jgi:hypothetical protein
MMGLVVHTCHPTYGKKHKIGGLQSRLACTKKEKGGFLWSSISTLRMIPQKVKNHTIKDLMDSEWNETSLSKLKRMTVRTIDEFKENI